MKYEIKLQVIEKIKLSSYTYQNFFRQLYGYKQVVTKKSPRTGNKRVYNYQRKGLLAPEEYTKTGVAKFIVNSKAVLDKVKEYVKMHSMDVKLTYRRIQNEKQIGKKPIQDRESSNKQA